MKKSHIFNIKKTKYTLLASIIMTYILIKIIITQGDIYSSAIEIKKILSILMPAILAMLSIYVSGIAVMIGTLRIELIKQFNDDVKVKLKRVIETFKYASSTAAYLFVMMLLVYLILSIHYSVDKSLFIFLASVIGFILIYTLLFLIQFTVYLVSLIIRIFEINLN